MQHSKEMPKVYEAIMKFKRNREQYSQEALDYYKPAFSAIERAYEKKDFEAFRKGLDILLGRIGDD